VGSLSNSNAIRPIGKKQIATRICQPLNPPFVHEASHLGHESSAILAPFINLKF